MDRDDQIISRFDCQPGTEHRAVDAAELEGAAGYGFTLVAVLYEDTLVQACDTDTVPVVDPSNIYNSLTRTSSKTTNHVVRVPRFLVRRDRETALSIMQEKLETANAEKWTMRESLKTEEARVAELTKTQAAAEKDRDRFKMSSESALASLDAERTTARRLEGELAKVRRAIGEKQMKEALSGG